jgi:hypothetical protein
MFALLHDLDLNKRFTSLLALFLYMNLSVLSDAFYFRGLDITLLKFLI